MRKPFKHTAVALALGAVLGLGGLAGNITPPPPPPLAILLRAPPPPPNPCNSPQGPKVTARATNSPYT